MWQGWNVHVRVGASFDCATQTTREQHKGSADLSVRNGWASVREEHVGPFLANWGLFQKA